MIIIGILSLYYSLKIISIDGVEAFYSLASRCWELIAGAILAYIILNFDIEKTLRNVSKYLQSTLSILGFFILIYGCVNIDKTTAFPGYFALLPVIGTLLIILSGPNALPNKYILSNKVIVWLGLISYPLYLWHWPILTFIKIIERDVPSVLNRIFAICASVFLAWVTYYFIERKIRSSSNKKIFSLLLFLNIIIVFLGLFIYKNNGLPERESIANTGFTKEVRDQFVGPNWAFSTNKTCLSEFPYKDSSKLAWWFCIKSSTAPPTILLLGNSFANQLYPGMISNLSLNHHSILSIGTCSIVLDMHIEDPRNPCFGTKADSQAKFIDDLIKNNNSLKYIIIDGLSRKPTIEYIEQVSDRISEFEKLGIKIIIFVPHLIPDFHPKNCFKSAFNEKINDCFIPLHKRKILLNYFTPLIEILNLKNPNVLFYDPNDFLCDLNNESCNYIKNSLPLYRDETHISEFGSVEIQKNLNQWLLFNVPEIFIK
jgi:hypothetical protein